MSGWSSESEHRAQETCRLVEQLRHATTSEQAAVIRQQLIVLNMPYAVALAKRYRSRTGSFEDLVQVAHLALVKGVKAFDPERGSELFAYITPFILGEIKKCFRDQGWGIRPPRRVQDLRPDVGQATAVLTQALGRSPRVREIAEHLGVTQEAVVECLAAQDLYTLRSLDTPVGQEAATVADTVGGPDPQFAMIEDVLSVGPALQRLPERDLRVVSLRFFEEWTQQQIADHIGITQMQVSRILTRICRQLRQDLLAA